MTLGPVDGWVEGFLHILIHIYHFFCFFHKDQSWTEPFDYGSSSFYVLVPTSAEHLSLPFLTAIHTTTPSLFVSIQLILIINS